MNHSITPRIVLLEEKKLVGIRMSMSFSNFKVDKLWARFMPRLKEIVNRKTNDLISMAIYQPSYFVNLNPGNEFEKWAAAEVNDFKNVSKDIETFLLQGGLYVVFDYKGLSTDQTIFEYIFSTWLPGSDYQLDDRPHFEILGDKYRNNDPESEEEIWIPIKNKETNFEGKKL